MITMMQADVAVFRDEKPQIFSASHSESTDIKRPAFYNSREVKELGLPFVKIHGARAVGILLTAENVFSVYNIGGTLMKWDYKAEMRMKALMKTMFCREYLSGNYPPDHLHGLLLGSNMELAVQILSNFADNHFVLDGSYENFFFLTNDHYGEVLLKLLCNPDIDEELTEILLHGLQKPRPGWTIEHDAVDNDGNPVLFAYTCNLPRIARFHTALNLQERYGTVICFDFQKEALSRYFSSRVSFQEMDFAKTERRIFHA